MTAPETAARLIGKLNIPKGVAQLLGGADYGTISGWYRSKVGSIYGPLLIAGLAIVGASASTAGEEEDRILALALAHPAISAGTGRRSLLPSAGGRASNTAAAGSSGTS